MPEGVELRILQRLHAEVSRPAHAPFGRVIASATARQIALLLALVIIAGWVFRSEVAPIFRQAWEKAHCWADPGAGKP